MRERAQALERSHQAPRERDGVGARSAGRTHEAARGHVEGRVGKRGGPAAGHDLIVRAVPLGQLAGDGGAFLGEPECASCVMDHLDGFKT